MKLDLGELSEFFQSSHTNGQFLTEYLWGSCVQSAGLILNLKEDSNGRIHANWHVGCDAFISGLLLRNYLILIVCKQKGFHSDESLFFIIF